MKSDDGRGYPELSPGMKSAGKDRKNHILSPDFEMVLNIIQEIDHCRLYVFKYRNLHEVLIAVICLFTKYRTFLIRQCGE